MDLEAARPTRRGESLFGLVMLVLAIGLFWQSWRIAGFSALSSPGAFPLAASFTMVVAAVIVVIGDMRRQAARDDAAILPFNVIVFTAFIAVYAALIEPLGFLPASFLFLFAGTKFLCKGGWLATAAISVLSLAAIYILFRIVFKVVLPEGITPEGEWLAAIGSLFSQGAK